MNDDKMELMISKPKTRSLAIKSSFWLLVSLLATLSLTLGLELVVIGPHLKSDKPPEVQLLLENQPIRSINITLGSTKNVMVSVSTDNASYSASLQILVSDPTIISAHLLVPGHELGVLALANGHTQIFILGEAYGISFVNLAELTVLVTQ